MTTAKAAQATAIYEELTDGLRLDLRVTDLVYQAADRYPDVLPTRAEIDREREHIQSEKQGLEIRQGEFVAEVLADPQLGFHLMHAMSQPRAEALAHIDAFRKAGLVDLGPILVERDGAIGRVTIQNRVPDRRTTSRPRRSRRQSIWCCSTARSTSVWCGRTGRTRSTRAAHLRVGHQPDAPVLREDLAGRVHDRARARRVSKMFRSHSTGHFEATTSRSVAKPWIAAVDSSRSARASGCS